MKTIKKYLLPILIIIFSLLIYFLYQRTVFINKSRNLNLILISVDTLRPDHMGIYGYNKNTTPNIDKWAKDATVFTNAYTIIPQTYPSFTSLFTGKLPFKTRVVKNRSTEGKIDMTVPKISDNTTTLAKILKKEGYVNGSFLSNNELSDELTSLGEGFDKKELLINEDDKNYPAFVSDSFKWLEENKNKKFFYWIHLTNPHEPYLPPDEYECTFNKTYCNEIHNTPTADLENKRKSLKGWGEEGCRTTDLPSSTVDLYKTMYDGEIAYSDKLIGSIFKKMEELGVEKNTLILFFGDHGEGFDHMYYFTHGGVVYNSQINIPLIIKNPLIKEKNKKSDALIDNTDILPTTLDLLGIKYDKNSFDGVSFKNIFTNGFISSRQKKYIYSSNIHLNKFSILDNNYKYIYSMNDNNTCHTKSTEEFYNIGTDKSENKQLNKEKTTLMNDYKSKLFKYFSDYNLPDNQNKPMPETDKEKTILNNLKSLGY